MPETVTELTVFLASPGDVARERRALDDVVAEINRTVGRAEGFRLAVVKWETRARPAMGRAQGVITQQLGPTDLFVGIMWKRFGTPTGKAGSGTEEEFDEAYAQWKRKRKHKPELLFYFRESKFYPKTPKETAQFAAVQAFREKVDQKALVWTYSSAARFADTVRPHLIDAARAVMARTTTKPPTSKPRPKTSTRPPSRRTTSTKQRPRSRPKKTPAAKPKHRLPKVPRIITDADRARYLSRSFTIVKRYFREAVEEINAHVQGTRGTVRDLEDGSLFVEVKAGGRVLNRARISKRSEGGWGHSIAFEQGPHLDEQFARRFGGSWSELARLQEIDGTFSFQLQQTGYTFGREDSKPKAVFEQFWDLFVHLIEQQRF